MKCGRRASDKVCTGIMKRFVELLSILLLTGGCGCIAAGIPSRMATSYNQAMCCRLSCGRNRFAK